MLEGTEVIDQPGKLDVGQYSQHYFLKLQEMAYYLTHTHMFHKYVYMCICIYFSFNTKGSLIYTLFGTLWAF